MFNSTSFIFWGFSPIDPALLAVIIMYYWLIELPLHGQGHGSVEEKLMQEANILKAASLTAFLYCRHS